MKNKLSILFYVLAVLFLGITIFSGVDSFIGLSQSASEYGVSLASEWLTVLKAILATSGGFLGFSGIFLGFGLLFNKIDKPQ